MRRWIFGMSLIFAALVGASIIGAATCHADQPKNVLFLICDDLNTDIGCYGHPQVQTPNIDRLAARGVTFDQAYCQYPLCGPSRASFMTGLYPDQSLVTRNGIYIREHVPTVNTMSQMFRDANYTATRVGKIYHYNVPMHIGTSGHDDPYSWDYTVNPRGVDRNVHDQIVTLTPGQFGGTLSWLAMDGEDSEQTDAIGADAAAAVLQKHADSKTPFFLAVGMYRPHTPYVAPKKYFDMYPAGDINVPTVPDGYYKTIPESAVKSIRWKKDQRDLDPAIAREAIRAYYASITFADAQVGRVLDALQATGLRDNTIVVFTSDHGYHMGEHGHYQKQTLFENATRVPLIMAGPGIASGASSKSMAEMVDFYPTLAELTGLTPPPYVAGKSLVPTLKDPNESTRQAALSQWNNGYSIRTTGYRYTEWGIDGADGMELYDHSEDPAEMNNVADDPAYRDAIETLRPLLRERIAEAQTPPKGLKQNKIENKRSVRQNDPDANRAAKRKGA